MIESNLSVLLAKRKMSLKELHEKSGVDYYYLSRLSNNKVKDFKSEYIFAICKVLKCKVGDLLEIIDEKKMMKVS